MKKTVRRNYRRRKRTLTRHLGVGVQSSNHLQSTSSKEPSRFQPPLDSDTLHAPNESVHSEFNLDQKDLILSQDFFCTPDYITPDGQNIANYSYCNKEDIPCPDPPDKLTTINNKKYLQDRPAVDLTLPFYEHGYPLNEAFKPEELNVDNTMVEEGQTHHHYVSQSAIALRCRAIPPPCIKNPYLTDASEIDFDPFSTRRSKCAGFLPQIIDSGDKFSRYATDFHEIEQIGHGNFSFVFKALKRIDGCMYAVKRSARKLFLETEKRKALMEVQALAALGFNDNVVGYHCSWFENEQLFIQMELCDHSLSIRDSTPLFTEGDILIAMHQVAKALQFIHSKGIVHLDVKPDNIYVKNGIYKLGDFGCATLLNKSLTIEEGDARYMPREILNDNFEYLDKVDVFSLGVSIYELVRGSLLPKSGLQFMNLKEGKLSLLPSYSIQFQNLLKAMLDPDPVRRPCARDIVEHTIFEKIQKNAKNK